MRTILAQDEGKINPCIFSESFSEAERYSVAERSVALPVPEFSLLNFSSTRKSLEGVGANSDNTEACDCLRCATLPDFVFGSPRGEASRSSPQIEQRAVLSALSESSFLIFPNQKFIPHEENNATAREPKRKKKICKSVKHCGTYSHASWKKIDAREILLRRFKCKSWRCPYCATKIAQRDFVRIRSAVLNNPGQWLFSVFTFNQKEYTNSDKAYESIHPNMKKLLKRIDRAFGKILYVQTVEQHIKGWPHVNMIFKFDDKTFVDKKDVEEFRARWLVKNAKECGFGRMLSCELAHGDATRIADYIAKTGLRIVVKVKTFSDYPAIDYVIEFINDGTEDTPIIEDIYPLDDSCKSIKSEDKVYLHQ